MRVEELQSRIGGAGHGLAQGRSGGCSDASRRATGPPQRVRCGVRGMFVRVGRHLQCLYLSRDFRCTDGCTQVPGFG